MMQDLSLRLRALGFTTDEYELRDTGEGPFIARWLSENPEPSPSALSGADVLPFVRRTALDRITAARDAALRSLTVELDGATFDADEASVQRMTSASIMLQMFVGDPRAPSTVSWLDHDNVPRELTPAQLAELAAAAWLATQQVWARNHATKVAIETADTREAIEAVEWPG